MMIFVLKMCILHLNDEMFIQNDTFVFKTMNF